MKKLSILSFLLLTSTFIFSQGGARDGIWWFDIGAKAQYGAYGLYNSAIADSDVFDYNINTGYAFGGKIGINHDNTGITIDVMKGSYKQSFEQNSLDANTIDWDISTLDFYLLYRNNANLGYFELGPKMSMMNKMERTIGGNTADFTDSFKSSGFGAVIGFGAYFMGSDGAFTGILGLRFEYGFTDINDTAAYDEGLPVNSASVYDGGEKGTHPAFAGIVFEINWGIGYFGKATCGSRSKFIMF